MAREAGEGAKKFGQKNPMLPPESPLFWQKQNLQTLQFLSRKLDSMM
jgi:hypothetical protein